LARDVTPRSALSAQVRQLHALVNAAQRQAAELVAVHCNASILAAKLHGALEARGAGAAASSAASSLGCEANAIAVAQCEGELLAARGSLAEARAAAGLNGRLGALEERAVRKADPHMKKGRIRPRRVSRCV
jgi:hypothetical protein